MWKNIRVQVVSSLGIGLIAMSLHQGLQANAKIEQHPSSKITQLPLLFERNQGQFNNVDTQFISRGLGYQINFTQQGAQIQLQASQPLQMRVVDGLTNPVLKGERALSARVHYLLGNDKRSWQTDIDTFSAIRYQQVYKGIDLVFYGNQGQLEYDFIVQPGAIPSKIKLAFAGASSVAEDSDGNLIINTLAGQLIQKAPIIYQVVDGVRRNVVGQYHIDKEHNVGFQIASYDVSLPLVIDPVLAYSSFLGGAGGSEGNAVVLDNQGNIYVAGLTASLDFPGVGSLQPVIGGRKDGFVAKFDPTGSSLIYATYLGGAGDDGFSGIDVDKDGNVYLAGNTKSTNFPNVNPFQGTFGGGQDAFVVKLNPSGSSIVYSTFLGGSGSGDRANGIAVDRQGNAYVVGTSNSSNFPTLNPFQVARAGGTEVFVTKLDTNGAGVYSTYFGGGGNDVGNGVAVDNDGNAYITGSTVSTNLPTLNPFQAARVAYDEAFVTKFNADGSALVFSTYIGGSRPDESKAIALDSSNNVYITGYSESVDFPLVNPINASNAGGDDVFVVKLDSSGASIAYSTVIGGSGNDQGLGIAVARNNVVYVTGETRSAQFPMTDPTQAATGGGTSDAFVLTVAAAGDSFLYASYLGGAGVDLAFGIDEDDKGNIVVVGNTNSANFPVVQPLQVALAGGVDAFVAKITGAGPTPPAKKPAGCASGARAAQVADTDPMLPLLLIGSIGLLFRWRR